MIDHFDELLDAKGLKCPQPLLLVKKTMKSLNSGQVLLVQATDPHTDLDLEVWCHRFGHTILASDDQNNVFQFWIEKGQVSK